MAKLAFWITAGPELEEKALAGLILAARLKANRNQDVQVYLFGPGVRLAANPSPRIKEALDGLNQASVPVSYCPANAKQYQLEEAMAATGYRSVPAGEAIVELAESGYEIVGY
ncbi:MAG: DsrE family protein [Firmicutes bacterium]|nr:DsrE family protein [Bacillota bacterium]